MNKVSTKQAAKNREVARIKATKPDTCIFCTHGCKYGDGVHLMNKNIFPQYYTEPDNIWKGHRECHTIFDDGTKQYRATLTSIIKLVRGFATREEIFQYFGV